MKITKPIKKLSEFLPPKTTLSIFKLLKEHYKDEKALAMKIGCDVKFIHKSLNGALNDHMPQILALGLQCCPSTRDVLKEWLEELESIYIELGILDGIEKGKIRKRNEFMNSLDEKSREIVWYLLSNEHAGIRELADLIKARTDMEVLTRVREVINPTAGRILGEPFMRFEDHKMDPMTGEKILFSWWLSEDFPLIERTNERLDVFDDKDQLKITTELPGIKEKDLRIDVKENSLIISANDYSKKIPLFYAVKGGIEKTYKNGILEIRLKKK